ncbi:substrate-binding domain-containing protein [Tamlana sp. I1]|uniref:LacI family DNA-binding transcriptional regulator n=1 Tax=Tamlana sp. I1 TaxID=2762061 RepID=UPI00188FF6AE|nr:substrate-binding domain-containing protein [Tamlana sp. I1]
MIRIKDIAQEAQVSEGTVDRVLHNRGGVSKKTEAKVKKILERHNYSINPVASALALKNKHTIAVLIPEHNDTDAFWKSPYLGILKAIEDVKSLGIHVQCFTFNQYQPSSYFESFQVLLESQPTAVIFAPMFLEETKKIVQQLDTVQIPYIFLNIDIEGFNNLAYIGQDSYTSGYIAGKLMHMGLAPKSDILIIQARDYIGDNNAIAKRIQGFHDYFKQHHINAGITPLKIESLNDSNQTKAQLNHILNTMPALAGIFIPSSRTSAVIDCFQESGYENFKIIGFDNTPQNMTYLKQDAVSFLISQKPFEQGYEAIRIMTDFLIKGKTPNEKIYLPIDILIKENVMYNDMNQAMYEGTLTNE